MCVCVCVCFHALNDAKKKEFWDKKKIMERFVILSQTYKKNVKKKEKEIWNQKKKYCAILNKKKTKQKDKRKTKQNKNKTNKTQQSWSNFEISFEINLDELDLSAFETFLDVYITGYAFNDANADLSLVFEYEDCGETLVVVTYVYLPFMCFHVCVCVCLCVYNFVCTFYFYIFCFFLFYGCCFCK